MSLGNVFVATTDRMIIGGKPTPEDVEEILDMHRDAPKQVIAEIMPALLLSESHAVAGCGHADLRRLSKRANADAFASRAKDGAFSDGLSLAVQAMSWRNLGENRECVFSEAAIHGGALILDRAGDSTKDDLFPTDEEIITDRFGSLVLTEASRDAAIGAFGRIVGQHVAEQADGNWGLAYEPIDKAMEMFSGAGLDRPSLHRCQELFLGSLRSDDVEQWLCAAMENPTDQDLSYPPSILALGVRASVGDEPEAFEAALSDLAAELSAEGRPWSAHEALETLFSVRSEIEATAGSTFEESFAELCGRHGYPSPEYDGTEPCLSDPFRQGAETGVEMEDAPRLAAIPASATPSGIHGAEQLSFGFLGPAAALPAKSADRGAGR
ncbi:protein of unknown function (plasmid) [Magnetospirillum sp. XM-1]|uniref:hypothetical protein n=1 Tax=Magnetospirillum sp. XM-1 TaxID=1663591 RepID=UPI00073DFB6D|nr:hypothetical protein [Magnetospirillum sp. XM-1]CUW41943.1 protein of unknown function [Magnetospirillum sp. XM-1]